MGSSTNPFRETITPISIYIENAQSVKFKISSLFSLGLFKQSFAMLTRSILGRDTYREVQRDHFISPLIRQYTKIYGEYQWSKLYPDLLERIKTRSPNSRFIVATSPVAKPLYGLMLEKNLLPYYKLWLRTLVSHFDYIVHCMDLNEVTENPRLFRDENHLWTSVTKEILPRIFFNPKSEFSNKDFGKKISQENIEHYLESL